MLAATSKLESSNDIRVRSERDEVLVHSIPRKLAKKLEISVPPIARENSALKPVFDVASLDHALAAVQSSGGVVTTTTFTFDGLTRHDVLDPDGNVIQLRSPAA